MHVNKANFVLMSRIISQSLVFQFIWERKKENSFFTDPFISRLRNETTHIQKISFWTLKKSPACLLRERDQMTPKYIYDFWQNIWEKKLEGRKWNAKEEKKRRDKKDQKYFPWLKMWQVAKFALGILSRCFFIPRSTKLC